MNTHRAGDILALKRRPVAVDPLAEYEEIGIRSFGRGIFHKAPVLGADLGNKRVFEILPGDLILNNVFAWEGAVALAGPEEDGKIGSHRFMTYVADPEVAEARYLRYFFMSEVGLALLGRASPGSAGRNRTLAIDRFAELPIPLPPISEQRRIAAKLDVVLPRVATAANTLTRLEKLSRAVVDAAIQAILDRGTRDGWPVRSIEDVAEINPAPTALDPTTRVMFVPMAAVDEVTGTIASPVDRLASDVSRGYKQFKRGDVIFARITPCMQNGKSAVADDVNTQYGYGSTEFHVLRPSDEVLPEWLHRIVRTRGFREAAAERFTGTAGQQRVPADFLRTAKIAVPETLLKQREALAQMHKVLLSHWKARVLQLAQRARLEALEPSILNRAFAWEA